MQFLFTSDILKNRGSILHLNLIVTDIATVERCQSVRAVRAVRVVTVVTTVTMSWSTNNQELDWVTVLETIAENECDPVKQRLI